MENTKYGKRREGRWTPIRAKAQDTRANPNSWELNSPSEEEMGHWTPTGIEPTDYDDNDDDDNSSTDISSTDISSTSYDFSCSNRSWSDETNTISIEP